MEFIICNLNNIILKYVFEKKFMINIYMYNYVVFDVF